MIANKEISTHLRSHHGFRRIVTSFGHLYFNMIGLSSGLILDDVNMEKSHSPMIQLLGGVIATVMVLFLFSVIFAYHSE
jgi:hypothetical protein